jgi:hypothetical protein
MSVAVFNTTNGYTCYQTAIYDSTTEGLIQYCTTSIPVTWSNAQSVCTSLGYTSVAILDNQDKQAFIMDESKLDGVSFRYLAFK